jgi:phage gp36-like protein
VAIAPYTDVSKLAAAYPDTKMGTVAPDLIQWAIDMAIAEVNGNVARRYTLPFTVRVPLLEKISTEIAVYQILTARPFTAPPRPIEATWKVRYDAAVAMLLKLGDGQMVLFDDGGNVIPMAGDVGRAVSTTQGYTPTFGEGADQNFFVDRNKLENESARRS